MNLQIKNGNNVVTCKGYSALDLLFNVSTMLGCGYVSLALYFFFSFFAVNTYPQISTGVFTITFGNIPGEYIVSITKEKK